MEREFSEEELAKYDGKEGRAAYIAYKGSVYDVSASRMWKNGVHANEHTAGYDLTAQLEYAPHGDSVFERYPKIGILLPSLQTRPGQSKQIAFASRVAEWNNKLHPHQMSVHFPIALHYFSAFFNLLFLFYPSASYEFTVFSSFVAATVMGVLALSAGIVSWWVKYGFVRSKPFMIKLIGATLTTVLGIIPICQRIENPVVAYDPGTEGFIYHFIIFFTTFTVSVVGYYGGKISWGGK